MSVVKHFVTESVKRTEIDEFLQQRLERAGYGGVTISKTPLGTHVVIYVMRPGLVIGRGGETIRELAVILEEKFKVSNPQISVSEIEIPELNAYVVASRVTSALQRGIHFRRAGFWALNQVMDSGALGAEIVISGKLRTERARFEKFRQGYLPKTGDAALKYMKRAEVHIQLKPGIFGVRVKIMPPDAQFPDKIQIVEPAPTEEKKPEEAEGMEAAEPAEEVETATETAESADAAEATPTEETAKDQSEPEPEEQEEAAHEGQEETE